MSKLTHGKPLEIAAAIVPVWHPSQREYFAAAALTGLAAWSPYQSDSVGLTAEETAKEAVNTADALIRELAKEPQE